MATLLEERAGGGIVAAMKELRETMEAEVVQPRSQNRDLGHPASEAQRAWAAQPIPERLQVIKRARHLLAGQTDSLCAAIPSELARNPADTMCAEILPLLAAFEFLEREAEAILAPRRLGKRGRPFWLMGVWSEVHRAPMGQVLVIAPANYPLFLPGVQVVQALAAGNAAIWKPGIGGRDVALLFAEAMRRAGLPEGLLEVTDDSIEAAKQAIAAGVDKVFFTGSATSGKVLLQQLAGTLTPCVAELSGCDAVFVLPSADLSRVAKALAFGMRLNGSATCMAPRRMFLAGIDARRRSAFLADLVSELDSVAGVRLPERVRQELWSLLANAAAAGASVCVELEDLQRPIVVAGVTAEMRIAQADIFAPVLAVMETGNVEEALAVNKACPYALTAAVFGDERESVALAAKITAGTVIINDLMVPAADPRTPFGGRKSSGFGVTQGAEGLLEMTAPKTIAVRRGPSTNHYEKTGPAHEMLFKGIIAASHLWGWRARIAGLKQVLSAANDLKKK